MNLEKVFSFIKEKKGYDYPIKYKLINGLPLKRHELYIKGHLNLSSTNITSLPDNLTVTGELDIHRTNLTSLPDNLTIGMDLDIRHTNITTLPNNLKISSSLFLSNTPLANIYDRNEIRNIIQDKGGFVRHIFN